MFRDRPNGMGISDVPNKGCLRAFVLAVLVLCALAAYAGWFR